MFVSDLLELLRRRRRWAIGALLLLVAVTGATFKMLPTTYQSSATVVLLPPVTSGSAGQNPFLSLGGLNQAVDVLVRDVTSTDVRAPLERSTSASFELTPDFTSDAPLLLLTVEGDEQAATRLQDDVLEVIPRQLTRIQSEVMTPERFRISTLTVTKDKAPTALVKPKLRALGLVIVAVAVLLLLSIAAADGVLRGRRVASRTGTPGPSPKRAVLDVSGPRAGHRRSKPRNPPDARPTGTSSSS